MKKDVCLLDVMKNHCKTCPFKPGEHGVWQDVKLANTVIERNLFQSQQTCHGVNDTKRCKGYYDYSFDIYQKMGLKPEMHLKNQPKPKDKKP